MEEWHAAIVHVHFASFEAASAGGLFHFKESLRCRLLARFGHAVMSD
jgi:hypothetical protein